MKQKIKFILGYFVTQIETTKHRFWVIYYCFKFCCRIMKNAFLHDLSKYSWGESKYFAKTIFDLKHSTYGTPEYKEMLDRISPAIKHHTSINNHHPEFYKNNKDIKIIEMIEMICDWKSATRRHANGNIFKSLEINEKRFNFDGNQMKIFREIVEIIN